MSEAYWLGGQRLPWNPPPEADSDGLYAARLEAASDLVSTFGLPLARLDRLDWFTGGMGGLFSRDALGPQAAGRPLSLLWPSLPLFGHLMLNNICAGLVGEENTLSALIDEGDDGAVQAALLGSPAAVGKFNLAPQARLTAHLSAPWVKVPLVDSFEQLQVFLGKHGLSPASTGVLAIGGPFQPEDLQKPADFQDASWIFHPACKGVALPLNSLVEALRAGNISVGLLVSISTDHRILYTLVEAV